MFQIRYTVLDQSVNSLKLRPRLLNMLERPSSFSVEPLQKTLDLLKSTFSGKRVLSEKENCWLWNRAVSKGVENVGKKDTDTGIARYSSRKELLLEYMESDSEWLWSADCEPGCMVEMVRCVAVYERCKREWSLRSGFEIRMLLVGMNCLRQCYHKDIQVIVRSRNLGFFRIVVEEKFVVIGHV